MRIKIDLFTDVVCPWCLIGSARLDAAVAALPAGIEVDIENRPFYLDPTTPPEGVVVADMLREKYHRDPRPMQERVEAEAAKSGIALDLSRQPRSFPTAKAHTLVRLARAKGTQHALSNAIAAAYFLEHRTINDDAVLAEIASHYGFSADEARAAVVDPSELAETEQLASSAAEAGISGVPFAIFDNRFAVSGAQPEEVFRQALQAAQEPADAPVR